MTDPFADRKARASAWFRTLRDRIVAAFEALEAEGADTRGADTGTGDTDTDAQGAHPQADAQGAHHGAPRFTLRETRRDGGAGEDAGGGLMSVLREGRVFEKVGVNISTVQGRLGAAAQAAMAARGVPGIQDDPRFWASGISLVAHMHNPHAPAVHMNTRMFWTPGAAWFGGGADLNPCLERPEDTAHFHQTLAAACAVHSPDYYPRFKAWADEYFFIPHRGRARGVGGIFYDDLATGDWEGDFAFTRAVGEAFLPAFLPLARARHAQPFTAADREAQLIHRGLYAEYNLVYDRGTKFGLASGHDPDAVLMSLPPLARWR